MWCGVVKGRERRICDGVRGKGKEQVSWYEGEGKGRYACISGRQEGVLRDRYTHV